LSEVAGHHFLARVGGRRERRDVGHAQHARIGLEPFAQHLAEAASGAGQKQPVEFLVRFHPSLVLTAW